VKTVHTTAVNQPPGFMLSVGHPEPVNYCHALRPAVCCWASL